MLYRYATGLYKIKDYVNVERKLSKEVTCQTGSVWARTNVS